MSDLIEIKKANRNALVAIIVALVPVLMIITNAIIDNLKQDNYEAVGPISVEQIEKIAEQVLKNNPDLKGEKGDQGLKGSTGVKGESGVASWVIMNPATQAAFNKNCDYKLQFIGGELDSDIFYATYVSADYIQHNLFISGDKNAAIKVYSDKKGVSTGSIREQIKLYERCEN